MGTVSQKMEKLKDSDFVKVSINGSGVLGTGVYKVVVASAGGGSSGKSSIFMSWCDGTRGGYGDVQTKLFIVDSSVNYTATIGKKGLDGRDGNLCSSGGNGAAGGSSTFKAGNIVNITTAGGGGGGVSHSGSCDLGVCSNGRNGTDAGIAGNAGDGYVILYRKK